MERQMTSLNNRQILKPKRSQNHQRRLLTHLSHLHRNNYASTQRADLNHLLRLAERLNQTLPIPQFHLPNSLLRSPHENRLTDIVNSHPSPSLRDVSPMKFLL